MRYVLALAMMATMTMFGSVAAAQTTPGAFIDVDNDGAWTAGDLPLADFLGAGSIGFNVYAAQPGWKPVSRPVGLVVRTPLILSADFVQQFILSGDIRILANVKVARRDTFVSFTTTGGDITIGDAVKIQGSGDVDFQTFNGGDITLGAGSTYTTKGEFMAVSFDADGLLDIGAKVGFRLSGNGYNAINLNARDDVRIAPGMTARIPGHGYFQLLCACDVVVPQANVKSGYIRIEGYGTARHPEAKRIHISDTTLQQTYRNGDFRIIAQADTRTSRYAADAIVLERTKISTASPDPLYLPEPIRR